MLKRLIAMEQKADWDEIINLCGPRGVHHPLEAVITGNAYYMKGLYEYAIMRYKEGYMLAQDDVEKARFIILVAECHSQMRDQLEAEVKLLSINALFDAGVELSKKCMVLAWRDIQRAKYERNMPKREKLLTLAKSWLDASVTECDYDNVLKERLRIWLNQQHAEIHLQKNELKEAAQFIFSAKEKADEANLRYEYVSTLLLEGKLQEAMGEHSDAKDTLEIVVEKNLCPRTVKQAQDILKRLK